MNKEDEEHNRNNPFTIFVHFLSQKEEPRDTIRNSFIFPSWNKRRMERERTKERDELSWSSNST